MSEITLRQEIEHIIEFGGTYTDAQGVPSNIKDADEIINLVREHDVTECPLCHGDKRVAVIAQAMGHRPDVAFLRVADERAKTIEDVLAAVDAVRSFNKTSNGDLVLRHMIKKAIKGVGDG
jgi:hypothetical protein